MKLLVSLILLLGVGIYFVYPPAIGEKKCYDISQIQLSDIGYLTVSRSLTVPEICEKRTNVLLDLHDCLEKITTTAIAVKYANTIVDGVVHLIRPTAKGYIILKNEHNAECVDFTTYQLE